MVIYSVKKKQSTAFCSYGVRDFFIQTTLPSDNMHWFKNEYRVIKQKQFRWTNSLNSEIINTPIMPQGLQVYIINFCMNRYQSSWYSSITVFDYKNKCSWIYAWNHTYIASTCISFIFSWTFKIDLDKSSEKFKSNQFKTSIIQIR